MKRDRKMIPILIMILIAAALLIACTSLRKPTAETLPVSETPEGGGPSSADVGAGTTAGGSAQDAGAGTTAGGTAQGTGSAQSTGAANASAGKIGALSAKTAGGAFAVKAELKEMTSVDPEKRIGVYGRYTELSAEGEVPETLARALAEVNARAKESVEAEAARFLAENTYPPAEPDPVWDGEHFRYHNVSYITNVTRADEVLFSILETGMLSGAGDKKGEWLNAADSCSFRASVYDTQSGTRLELSDFVQDPAGLGARLEAALKNKYAADGLYTGGGSAAGAAQNVGAAQNAGTDPAGGETPAWTADYLGLRFYFDEDMVPAEKRGELAAGSGRAVHVSIPYTALDGPLAAAAALTPESFIAQLEKNTEYALPHDKRSIFIEKATDEAGYEQYRIVIRDGRGEKGWWLEHAGDASDYYVMRTQDGYFFYRLEEAENKGYIYNFASPDGGYDRFENQNAQCFDSYLQEPGLAVPYNPSCVHMREKSRKFMDAVSGLNTYFTPSGHYSFRPERGRGRTWLHFALIDDALALDSRNVGCRLLHEISGTALDAEGNESGEVLIPAGEVLQFLRVNGESELYYYMSPEYNMYKSGARDYFYDCALTDGRRVRLVTRYESSFFVDGMYMDRIGEPVTLGAAQYEAGLGEVQEHYVEIAGKRYHLIRDLSLQSESGEEIDFDGDIWWQVENYVGTFSSEDGSGSAKLVIAEDGDVRFEFGGKVFAGKLPEHRYYRSRVSVYMEAEYERRSFQIIILDNIPPHDPSFQRIRFYSAGLPATNEPSKVPPIEVELVRE